jgi:hypothetical protein
MSQLTERASSFHDSLISVERLPEPLGMERIGKSSDRGWMYQR